MSRGRVIGCGDAVSCRAGDGVVVRATVGVRQHGLVVRCLPRRPTTRDGGIRALFTVNKWAVVEEEEGGLLAGSGGLLATEKLWQGWSADYEHWWFVGYNDGLLATGEPVRLVHWLLPTEGEHWLGWFADYGISLVILVCCLQVTPSLLATRNVQSSAQEGCGPGCVLLTLGLQRAKPACVVALPYRPNSSSIPTNNSLK